jgi:regulator of protease activity HflC (stomatin/prohibitin superfamily)
LVERNLAKVKVAGSRPVFRSKVSRLSGDFFVLYKEVKPFFSSFKQKINNMIPGIILGVFLFLILLTSFKTVQQGTVAVTTIFGKYNRTLTPGLNFKIPIIEKVYRKISIQNRSAELGFQAVTIDQANVNFTAMLLYSVFDQQESTIKNVAFKFIDDKNLMQALVRSIEGSVRAFVATKKQSEVLGFKKRHR